MSGSLFTALTRKERELLIGGDKNFFYFSIQCDSKENFIEKIKELDLEVQKHLVDCIKQVLYIEIWYYTNEYEAT